MQSIMRSIRMLLCLLYAFTAAITAFLMVAMMFPAWQSHYKWHGKSHIIGALEYDLLLLPFATVFGLAWWTIFMTKRGARAWAFAASALFLLFFIALLVKQSLAGMGCGILFGIAGILGLIAFARRTTILDFQEPGED